MVNIKEFRGFCENINGKLEMVFSKDKNLDEDKITKAKEEVEKIILEFMMSSIGNASLPDEDFGRYSLVYHAAQELLISKGYVNFLSDFKNNPEKLKEYSPDFIEDRLNKSISDVEFYYHTLYFLTSTTLKYMPRTKDEITKVLQ